jgi:hypothetical protein
VADASVPTALDSNGDLATNVLYYGDNLDIQRRYLPDAAVDLGLPRPPFTPKAP